MNKLLYILLLSLFIFANNIYSQTPGAIFVTPTGAGAAAILDPNLNGYVSSGGTGFSSIVLTNSADESMESEIAFIALNQPYAEPTGDTQTGGTCNATEIIDNPVHTMNSAFYYYLNPDNSSTPNGDEKLLLRMRLAKVAAGNYGYSFLIDTDNLIGNGVDPNYISGNPGFEVEILYGSGASGVQVYNCDGSTGGTLLAQYPNNERVQKSYIKNTNCSISDVPYFLDFYINYSTISSLVGNNNLRIAWASSSSPSSALGGSASDIGGYGATASDDDAFVAIVNGSTTSFSFTSGDNLPIELTSFETICENENVVVNWQTASEWNTDYYVLESTRDFINWNFLRKISAAGNSVNAINYHVDLSRIEGDDAKYVRLTEYDLDGTSIIYTPLKTECSNDFPVTSPNPVDDFLTLTVPEKYSSISIHLLDGKIIYEMNLESQNEITVVNVQDFLPGIYLVHFNTDSNERYIARFLKL